tara:strand:- start:39 stop:221 length:183 start_codon:yes stop_codon:yes gene_type:complete
METYRLSFDVTTDADPDLLLKILQDLGFDLEDKVESYGFTLLNFKPKDAACVAYVTEGEE